MTTFHIHEDFSYLVENVQLKQKTVKVLPDNKKHRTVLQPLSNYQQNAKRPKTGTGEENTAAIPKKTKNDDLEKLPNPLSDIVSFKPVFKKNASNSMWLIATSSIEKEYEDEIWTYLTFLEKKLHKIKPSYMTKQIYLNWQMRSVLIDWLINVAEEYQLSNYTVHLSINYLDRFLSNISVIKEKFQLVGATAMMIAGKMEEVYPPDTREWAFLTGDAFTVRQIIKMEQLMLKILKFDMHAPTILDFIKHLCAKHKQDNTTMYLAMYLSELVLLEGEDYLQQFPSKLASASLVLARHTLFKPEPWTKNMEESAGYSLKQLSPVVQKQQKTFRSSPFKEQQTIQKKYASDKYQRVALLKPRILLLEEDEE
ncbi:G2/mitotic-specific cyclin-A [Asbolus verrucosus]|uniref:G2/mitotic-specific cyclin-A n=1 Tax=Asbolus verrucosus TaxID=1661398 RepID=A0A482VHT2_ASBVE|nr:G2/mitotic-specific cyclin-A [Asbolus verrucosus]